MEALARVLADPPDDPFERDIVAVPARGVERWITQQLSAHLGAAEAQDGVCARVEFPFPSDLLLGAVAAASPGHSAAVDAWRPDRAVWSMIDVLDEVLSQPPDGKPDWCAPLRQHLMTEDGAPSDRRYGLARRLTDLFTAYGSARPHLLRSWAAGSDEAPADLGWQPELWRCLRSRIGVPAPAQLLDEACTALRARPEVADLPARLSIFGASRLDAVDLQVLSALAADREVHLWINSASPVLWEFLARMEAVRERRADLRVPVTHPLLASLSRDVRELQLRLRELPIESDTHHAPAGQTDPRTLLEHVQADVRSDWLLRDKHKLAANDRSVQVHACHGRARQVEVLREVVVGLLQDDPTLEPRDVLIMCPDIEAYAPLISSVFGADRHPGTRLRLTTADRSPRRVNPLLQIAAELLDLAGGRVTATQVLALAGAEPVRLRFGFDEDGLERLRGWAVSAGVKWGLSAEHRDRWQMGHLDSGTWRSGIDRLLAGVAFEQDDVLLGTALPVDDVDSAAVDLAGRFAEFVDRLDSALTRLGDRQTITDWLDVLQTSIEVLTAVPAKEAWQSAGLRREVGHLAEASAGSTAEIGLVEMTSLMAGRLEARPTSSGFRTGGVTVCTLTPMRSVPHRVICLLGMDDGAFPRQPHVDGDNLLLRDPCLGERDARSEDRQLFLDALAAAGEHLVVIYGGADIRTGAQLPPAVPVAELLDALDSIAVTADGLPARSSVVINHPLQPFDRRNFLPGALGRPGPFSFDASALAGAVAAAGPRVGAPPFLSVPLPPISEAVVGLTQLVSFWQNPSKEFLRQRLGVVLPAPSEELDHALPAEADGLALWAVGDRVLQARLRGVDGEAVRALERARGVLPPSPLGDRTLDDVCGEVDRLLIESAVHRSVPAESLVIDAVLSDHRRVLGSVHGVRDDVLLSVTYSKVQAKQRLRAWIELLALSTTHPDRQWQGVVVGRADDGQIAIHSLGPVGVGAAREALAGLLRLRDFGCCAPLPLPIAAGEAYAAARARGQDRDVAWSRAAGSWTSAHRRPGEDVDPAHAMLWGKGAPMAVLEEWTAPAGVLGPDAPDEPTDFGRLARTVWQPLLALEGRVLR